MPLPKEIPTLQHMVTKRYSRPNNVFCTERLQELIVRCEVDPSLHLTSTDHFPIVMKLIIPQECVVNLPSFNFREADWDSFRQALQTKLNTIQNTMVITNKDQLTEIIQETIQQNIHKTKLRPDAKGWWNSNLNKMKKALRKLRCNSYKYWTLVNHPSHTKFRRQSNMYGEAKLDRLSWRHELSQHLDSKQIH